jgi:hypothetical protein
MVKIIIQIGEWRKMCVLNGVTMTPKHLAVLSTAPRTACGNKRLKRHPFPV